MYFRFLHDVIFARRPNQRLSAIGAHSNRLTGTKSGVHDGLVVDASKGTLTFLTFSQQWLILEVACLFVYCGKHHNRSS